MADFSHSMHRTQPSATFSKKISSTGNGFTGKTVYDDVFGGPPKFGVPTFSSRIDDYDEIFGSFNSSRVSSIPILDLPIVVDESDDISIDVRNSKFNYSEVFGGFNGLDFAVSYEDLLAEPKGGESSSDDAWTSAETGSQSEGSSEDPACSKNNHAFSNEESYESLGETKKFNILYQKTNQINTEDVITATTHIARLNSVPGYSFIVDSEKEKVISNTTNFCDVDADIGGQVMRETHLEEIMLDEPVSHTIPMISKRDLKHKGNFPKEYTSDQPVGQPTSGIDMKHKKGHHKETNLDQPVYQQIFENDEKHERNQLEETMSGNGNYRSKSFVTVSEINLRTVPSHVPPPSRPPPKVSIKRTDNDGSPTYFDVEVDASSSAAAAAMKEVMEKAQARLKCAKESMERKKEGLQNRKKVNLKDGTKAKEQREGVTADETDRFHEKAHATFLRENNEIKGFDLEERHKTSRRVQVAPDFQLTEKISNISTELINHKHGEKCVSTQESNERQNATGEGKVEDQYFELLKVDKLTANMDEPRLKEQKKCKSSAPELIVASEFCYWKEDENKFTVEIEREERVKKAKVSPEREKHEQKLQESLERLEHEKQLKQACRKEEYEIKEKEIHEEENEKKQRVDDERGENEERATMTRESREKEKRLQEACEQEGSERRQKGAYDREVNAENKKAAQELEESEKRQEAVLDYGRTENEKRLEEIFEREENKKQRLNEAREREENEKRREAREREENEKRLAHEKEENEKRLAHESKENEKRVAREKEETEKRLAREKKENEERLALEREESEERLKEAREKENENRLKDTRENEEREKRLKEARERDEYEKRLKEARERDEYEKRLKEARERNEYEKRLKEALECDECEKGSREAFQLDEFESAQQECTREDNDEKLKAAQEALVCSEEGENLKNSNESLTSAQIENKLERVNEMRKKGLETSNAAPKETNQDLHTDKTADEPEQNGKMMETATHASEHKEIGRELKAAKRELNEQDGICRLEKEHVGQSATGEDPENKRKMASDGKSQDDTKNSGEPRAPISRGKNEWNEKPYMEAQGKTELAENFKKMEAAHPTNVVEQTSEKLNVVNDVNISHETERKTKIVSESLPTEESEKEKRMQRERERLRKLEEDREREREREKDRMAVERATREARERAFADARERAERAAVERATAEARQRAMAEARDRLEKASAEAREKSLAEKASIEARLKAERAAVERATAEARARAVEKARTGNTAFSTRERTERTFPEKFSTTSRDSGMRHSSSFSDVQNSQFQSSSSSNNFQRYSHSSNNAASYVSQRFQGAEIESAQRSKARLERHQRTVERAAKALAEKNMRDLLAQREQSERNRFAETLDIEVKRWSNGKEGNLRALLSTLQYILGPNSGWQPIPLTEVITAVAVKKAYRKATLCVHPDKLQQRGATIQQKYICEKVFDLLKEAWNKFNSEER